MNFLTHMKWISIIHTATLLSYYFIATDSPTTSLNYRGLTFAPGKRNTWWSKKSLSEDRTTAASKLLSYEDITRILDCYADTCLTALASCIRKAEDVASEVQCKYQHRKCALRCFEYAEEVPALTSPNQ